MTSSLRAVFAMAIAAACLAGPAFADDLVGAYVGGGVGLAHVKAGTRGLAPGSADFDRTHLGYHIDFGVRPGVAPLALELEYLDLGEPHLSANAWPGLLSGKVSQRGEGLFLLYYLPIPIVQVYAKAGGSHITTHADATSCGATTCQIYGLNPTNNAFAFGAGLQWTLGRWAVRGEYEHFNAGGGNPSLLTIGIDWTFL